MWVMDLPEWLFVSRYSVGAIFLPTEKDIGALIREEVEKRVAYVRREAREETDARLNAAIDLRDLRVKMLPSKRTMLL